MDELKRGWMQRERGRAAPALSVSLSRKRERERRREREGEKEGVCVSHQALLLEKRETTGYGKREKIGEGK